MSILRSVAAVLAGLGFMVSTVMAGSLIAAMLFIPGGIAAVQRGAVPAEVPPLYLAANLGVSFMGAVFGGWLAARIGTSAPLAHAGALAALTAVMALLSAQQPAGPQPGWYPAVIGAIGVAGVLAGGKLRAAAAGGVVA